MAARWAVAAPSLLLAVVATVGLGHQPLWYDEIATVTVARRSVPHIFALLGHTDAVLGPYYLFMHVWTEAGTASWWVRTPSVLAGVLTVALTAWLGLRLRGPLVGLLGGVLLALNPFFVFYARDARPYTMVAAACVGAAHLLVPRPAAASRRRRAAWVAAATGAVYLHLFAGLVVGAQAMRLLVERAARRWRAALVAVPLLAAPMAWAALHEQNEIGWLHRAAPWTYLSAFSAISGGVGLAVLAGVLAVAAVALAKDRLTSRWLLGWAMLPTLVLVTVSLLHPVFVARYVLGSVPAISLLAAIGAVELSRAAFDRWRMLARLAAAGAVLASLVVGGTAVAAEQHRPYFYEDMPAAVDLVLDGSHAGDGIAYLSGTVRMSARYYLPSVDPGAPRPQDVLFARGQTGPLTGTFGGRMVHPGQAVDEVAEHGRVWVLQWKHARPGHLDGEVLTLLDRRYHVVERRLFGQAEVTLWQRGAPAIASAAAPPPVRPA